MEPLQFGHGQAARSGWLSPKWVTGDDAEVGALKCAVHPATTHLIMISGALARGLEIAT
jgi:hypothetical protein